MHRLILTEISDSRAVLESLPGKGRAWAANLLMSCLTESSLVWSIWKSSQFGGAGYLQGQRDVPMTVAPVAATRSAAALPIPVDAPVMRTTLPRRFCTGGGSTFMKLALIEDHSCVHEAPLPAEETRQMQIAMAACMAGAAC